MEEIKLWNIQQDGDEKPKAIPVETVAQTATEQLLEEILTASPDILMPNLRLIGCQTETPGGPLDLLGVDEDGRLVVLGLKRGHLTRDAIAQVIDYASYLAELEAEELCRHINENSGKGGTERVEDFAQWYQSQFQHPVADIGRPRVMLVGLGVDERAKRMVAFLAHCELDISLITFHGFKQGDKTLLARQIEVQAKQNGGSVKSTKRDNQAKLDKLLANLQIKSHYDAAVEAVKSGLGASTYQWPNPTGYSFYLPEVSASGGPTNRAYVGVFVSEKQRGLMQIYLHARAVEAVGADNVNLLATEMGSQFTANASGAGDIWLDGDKPVSTYLEALSDLGSAIATGWKTKMESQAKAEADFA